MYIFGGSYLDVKFNDLWGIKLRDESSDMRLMPKLTIVEDMYKLY